MYSGMSSRVGAARARFGRPLPPNRDTADPAAGADGSARPRTDQPDRGRISQTAGGSARPRTGSARIGPSCSERSGNRVVLRRELGNRALVEDVRGRLPGQLAAGARAVPGADSRGLIGGPATADVRHPVAAAQALVTEAAGGEPGYQLTGRGLAGH